MSDADPRRRLRRIVLGSLLLGVLVVAVIFRPARITGEVRGRLDGVTYQVAVFRDLGRVTGVFDSATGNAIMRRLATEVVELDDRGRYAVLAWGGGDVTLLPVIEDAWVLARFPVWNNAEVPAGAQGSVDFDLPAHGLVDVAVSGPSGEELRAAIAEAGLRGLGGAEVGDASLVDDADCMLPRGPDVLWLTLMSSDESTGMSCLLNGAPHRVALRAGDYLLEARVPLWRPVYAAEHAVFTVVAGTSADDVVSIAPELRPTVDWTGPLVRGDGTVMPPLLHAILGPHTEDPALRSMPVHRGLAVGDTDVAFEDVVPGSYSVRVVLADGGELSGVLDFDPERREQVVRP